MKRRPSMGGPVYRALASCALLAACSTPARTPAQHPPAAAAERAAPLRCSAEGLVVQVLGSGGPIAGADGRKSTAYLVWLDGRARLLVDLGQGATHGFGQSGASLDTLDAILISHLHVDHAGDLAAFVKSASFHKRARPLLVAGPTGSEGFPAFDEYARGLFGTSGLFAYLKALQPESDFSLTVKVLDATPDTAPTELAIAEDITVRALGVEHGPPALAYEVRMGGRKIVFMGDQRAETEGFAALLRDADLFVAHMAIGQAPSAQAKNLHATPSRLGEVAAKAAVKSMVVSHLMERSLRDLEANLDAIRASYAGPLAVADDGSCLSVSASGRP